MSNKSKIEWTDASWNTVTGCDRASEGCKFCYAERMAKRLQAMGVPRYVDGFAVRTHPEVLGEPFNWRKPRRIFVCSMGDLFHEDVPFEFIAAVYGVMGSHLGSRHCYQVLTKRPDRMLEFYQRIQRFRPWIHCRVQMKMHVADIPQDRFDATTPTPWPLPNVWVGVTAENQARANERIPLLLEVPAVVKYISAEPLLGPIDLRSNLGGTLWMGGQRGCGATHRHSAPHENGTPGDVLHHHHDDRCKRGLDWVITGGESGPNARTMDPTWVRALRDQCVAADVPFFMKQWGGRDKKKAGSLLDGREWKEFPK